MIRAKVKGIYCAEMDLDSYRPVSPDHFLAHLRVLVGPKDSDGEESFDVTVCSPSVLAEVCEKEGFVVGKHYLFVKCYDPPKIRRIITRLIESVSGLSWKEVAEKVSRFGYWEFEDYRPAPE